jgi:microfibrillar-associated protein 1
VKREIERAEIERRRKLTDSQRAYENKMLGSDSIKPEKQKYKFMQKYYKVGAFYQDSDDPIFKRDYNVSVGEDNWDKSNLPKILQTRRGEFGTASRSKYTHLNDQV